MKVKELIAELSKQDPELEILCYTEDETILPENHLFRLIDIESISIIKGEKRRGDDGIPSLKIGVEGYIQKHVIINLLTEF
ncbi:hypothetical protein [Pseudomonas sp.]|uniref:hypothetical protein n=1 Tax=Pseudomonas sp. TaxID=306 RepID=UPI0032674BC4